MDGFRSFTSKLEKILTVIATIMFMIFFMALVIQVLFRYVFKKPLTWTEELAKLLNVWIVLFGTAIAVKTGNHIKVEMFDNVINKLGYRTKKLFNILTKVIAPFFLVLVLLKGSYTMMIGEWFLRFTTLPLPQGLLYMPLLISSLVMIMFLFENLIDFINGKEI